MSAHKDSINVYQVVKLSINDSETNQQLLTKYVQFQPITSDWPRSLSGRQKHELKVEFDIICDPRLQRLTVNYVNDSTGRKIRV